MSVRVYRAVAAFTLVATLAGCNRYALFNKAGYEQAAFSNDADILFVVDNSSSMSQEAGALGTSMDAFIERLTSTDGAVAVTETLTDAVDNYITYTQERGKFLDYRIGITTTTPDDRASNGMDPGEGGRLVGPPILKDDPDVAGAFRETMLCDTTYWPGDTPRTNQGEITDCSTAPEEGITQEYLDCVCGFGVWEETTEGTGTEEHLESALMALCRSVENPPDACYDDTWRSVFPEVDPANEPGENYNEGFIRDGSTVVLVIVTDEGDSSRRMPQTGAEIELATPYLNAFAEFDNNIKVVGIGPLYNPEADTQPRCIDGPGFGGYLVDRIIHATEETGGFYRYIVEEDAGAGCANSDFSEHLTELGALLEDLDTAFQLQSVPDVSTIQVWLNGEEVPKAPPILNEASGETTYTEGWSYDSGKNAVVFWGKWIPDYNADVEIFYRPLSDKPRDLPF
ncbi:MAG: hypothetical protein CL927_02035 [Deltaproteobacteria bacterium]|nr:hypothetical protein [Deltaproteobacteria bacterium]